MVPYQIIRSRRKTISLQITPAGQVIVRCPARMRTGEIRAFVQSKSAWLEKNLRKIAERPRLPAITEEERTALVRRAKEALPCRVAYYAPLVGVDYGRITIRSQRTRWGSCTAKGNLNFNCLLLLCPEEVADYVVVHELCHRRQMNHSAAFWAEVERVLPEYRRAKRWLKEQGPALMARLEG